MPSTKNDTTKVVNDIFFNNYDINEAALVNAVSQSLNGMDDGELFMEYCVSESVSYDESKVKSASFDTTQGFGLRGVLGESTAYAHSSVMSVTSLKDCSNVIQSLKSQAKSFKVETSNLKVASPKYNSVNPLQEYDFSLKVKILEKIDNYLRSKDPRVKQVSASISGEWQVVHIIQANGSFASDVRPLVRVNVSVVVEDATGRKEVGSYGMGGRDLYSVFLVEERLLAACDKALKEGVINLTSRPSPAGTMDVVLGSGWPGILLHEAVGHGLEGDFHRKKTSVFTQLMGKEIASKGVTVIDDGTLDKRRGSLSIDDEGTPTQKNILIENGVLTGLMQDKLNARLMGQKPTGNGRRENYESVVLPRMTNTYMLGGNCKQEDLFSDVKDGIYAVSFGGGQVDITSGNFVFSANEAYKIENGKIKYPIKGATLIGNGADALKRIRAVADNMQLDDGVGTCGKEGQGVPVGVGQPSILISGLTVGGTEV